MTIARRAGIHTTLLLLFLGLLTSCSAHKKTISNRQARKNNNVIQKANRQAINDYTTYTVASYIDRFKDIAIKEMNAYGVPASITLAQGLFESGNGNSDLAKFANNHFGIKCTSDWYGKSFYRDDDQLNDCFRVYDNPDDSYRDHSQFLKRKHYAFLFELDKNDYKGWAYGLKKAGYATNPKYPELIISVIERYNLDQFDRPETDLQKIKREDRVLADINKNIGKEKQDSATTVADPGKLYTVTKGDTLFNISRRFAITVDDLKALNNLTDAGIKIGQKLLVVK